MLASLSSANLRPRISETCKHRDVNIAIRYAAQRSSYISNIYDINDQYYQIAILNSDSELKPRTLRSGVTDNVKRTVMAERGALTLVPAKHNSPLTNVYNANWKLRCSRLAPDSYSRESPISAVFSAWSFAADQDNLAAKRASSTRAIYDSQGLKLPYGLNSWGGRHLAARRNVPWPLSDR